MIKFRYTPRKLRDAYKAVFKDDEMGRLVLNDILRYCHVLSASYVQGDTEASAVKEGQRDVGLRILRILNVKEVDAQSVYEDQRNYLVGENANADEQ